MAMMAKMRSLAPAFILTVGALFVLFMIISDSNVLQVFGSRTNNVGSINGEPITYAEFAKVLDRQRESQKQQTGQDVDEERMDQFRDQVWDAIVTQKLLAEKIKEFGISVSDDEVRDIILGDNPPQFLKQNFTDSLGNFNRQLYEQALFDPQNKEVLLNAEEYVRQNRLSEKLQSMLYASVSVSEAEIKNRFIEQNTSINAKYALIDLNIFPDSTIKVTDTDIKEYYDTHLDQYKVKAQRKLKYVLFENKPSAEDSTTIITNLVNVKESLSSDTSSFESYVKIYSTAPYSKDTVTLSALGEAGTLVSQAAPGSVVGPAATNEGFVLYHVINTVPSTEILMRASHILINQYGSDEANLKEANKLYDQLTAGADFSMMAKEFSTDKGSGERGGDLGWFGKGQMVPEFDKAVFEGKPGVIQKPVKTTYGYHIIKVTGKSDKKYVIEKIVNPIKASAATIESNISAARDFSYLADKNGFEKEAQIANYKVLETTPFDEEAYAVPGLGQNKRMIEFAFENSNGDVSDVFKAANGYAVVMISESIKEGFRPFEELKTSLKPVVVREKKYAKALVLADKVSKQISSDLDKVSQVDSRITVTATGIFTPSGVVPNVGRDYAFINTALDLPLNKVSGPVKGNRGYYFIQVTERSGFDKTLYESQRASLSDNILREKKSTFFNLWLAQIKKDADIVDDRYMFYGQ